MNELKKGAEYEGMINISAKGIGYIKLRDLDTSLEIPHEALNRALPGDTVKATITSLPDQNHDLAQAKVTEITRRAKVGYAGTLSFLPAQAGEQGAHCVLSGDGRMYTNIEIPSDKLAGATTGQKVFCTITDWTDPLGTPKGEVVRVLGAPFENNAEMLSFALEKGFDDGYPSAVEEEAKKIHERGIPKEEYENRRDFRDTVTFTIDPADAKDFDDAISVKMLSNGDIEIGIHIADVSHYVVPETELDKEAYRRATSVYLVDRTIPMLPEVLSNELCSLNPNVDRLTFSAVFTFDTQKRITSEWYGKTVIHSHHRFSYEDAQKVLDTKEGPYLAELEAALSIAQFLEKERFTNGAIAIDTREVKFTLDAQGAPTGVYVKERGPTHHMIEELMLLANRKVAESIATGDKHADEVFVFRVHEMPDPERMSELRDFLKRIGYTLPLNEDGIIPSVLLNKLMIDLKDKPEKETVGSAIVRSMAKAVYSTKNIGHYGLAFKYYTHFTSPIRRYPDLIVHRLLFEYLQHRTIPKELWDYYDRASLHSSVREKEAADAERASIKYKQVEYMAQRIGKIFDGTITGISPNGVFVEEKESRCEGMIRLRDLGSDFYEYKEKDLAIIGRNKKERFEIGDTIRFKVSSTDLAKRIIDYVKV